MTVVEQDAFLLIVQEMVAPAGYRVGFVGSRLHVWQGKNLLIQVRTVMDSVLWFEQHMSLDERRLVAPYDSPL